MRPEVQCRSPLVLTIGMPVQGDYEPSAQAWVRDQVELFENSGGTKGTTLRDTGIPIVVVTNLGVSSGKVRKTPVMRVEHDGRYAMVASKGGAPEHPQWYYNLRANPLVELQDGPVKQDMTVREVSGAERDEWWQRAVAVYPSYADYQRKTSREIPVFVLEPATES
jgi:F420H(2)-dependent quinone reductase